MQVKICNIYMESKKNAKKCKYMYRKVIKIFSENLYTPENVKRNANMYTCTRVIQDASEQNAIEVFFSLQQTDNDFKKLT